MPQDLLTIATVILTILYGVSQWQLKQISVRGNEIELLRSEILRLQSRVADLEERLTIAKRNELRLMDYISKLRSVLIEHDFPIPEMPDLETFKGG